MTFHAINDPKNCLIYIKSDFENVLIILLKCILHISDSICSHVKIEILKTHYTNKYINNSYLI